MGAIRKKRAQLLVLVGLTVASFWPLPLVAGSSNNYQIQEDFVGGGGGINGTSPSFQAADTLGGGAAVGDSNATHQRTQTGATTTSDPALTFLVSTSSVSLGSLNTSLTRTGTASFSVLNYTSYGYTVSVLGSPPNNGVHTLTGLSSPTASSIGTEQFGINLVANSLPSTFGADPSQVPSSSFSFGAAAAGYNSANSYKYVSGNTIASAVKSSGQTTYTISYIANIANSTPGGSYSGNETLVVVGTY
ncbi:MAG TPA: hypothetical protein VNG90_00485 [Candidatus Acidoferrum sp.]|nr:hypothetical protein [Candidatus Acidoferrum sp.]